MAAITFSLSLLCSTPRGITGTLTPETITNQELTQLCSTPRGITGTLTSKSLGTSSFPACAQRLAASLVLSLVFWGTGTPEGVLCSTPRGITGTLTGSGNRTCWNVTRVLNASRHHWYSHIKPVQTPGCQVGDVLNASRHHWYSHTLTGLFLLSG